jgi:hypothetical protein
VAAYSVNMRRAIITWPSHNRSARKTVRLLQFRRPSLHSAVTAFDVVADEDCSSGNATSAKYPGMIEITLGAPC